MQNKKKKKIFEQIDEAGSMGMPGIDLVPCVKSRWANSACVLPADGAALASD